MHSFDTHAVSEVIGILLILTISSSIISATLLWSGERMTSEKFRASTTSTYNQIRTINDVFEELISQGKNSSRMVNFVADQGYVSVGSSGTRFIIFYSVNFTFWFNVTGLNDNDSSCKVHLYDGKITDVKITYLNTGNTQMVDINPDVSWDGHDDIPDTDVDVDIVAQAPLIDAVKIDLKNGSNYMGRIWLFDLGYITYEASSNQGVQTLVLENDALIRRYPDVSYIVDDPKFYCNVTHSYFFPKIFQLKPDADTTMGPGGAYKFTLKLDESIARADETVQRFCIRVQDQITGIWTYQMYNVAFKRGTNFNFKIQIFWGDSSLWQNYITSLEDGKYFACFNSGMIYSKTMVCFFLLHSVCEVKTGVVIG
jgi:hypothetical protein